MIVFPFTVISPFIMYCSQVRLDAIPGVCEVFLQSYLGHNMFLSIMFSKYSGKGASILSAFPVVGCANSIDFACSI